MKSTLEIFRHFLASEEGPTAVEYGVMLALIIVVAAIAIGTFGQTVNNMLFELANDTLFTEPE